LPQTLILPSQSFQLRLILVDLSLLFVLPLPLSHQLIPNQSAGYQAYRTADQGAHCGMSHGAADNRTASSPQASTDQSA
jgi:hypothetical protein